MSPTFETVLEQAKSLTNADRRRLVDELSKPNGNRKRERRWDDDPTIKALRAWVDKIEESTDPEIRSSIETAERIRKWNDRGFKL